MMAAMTSSLPPNAELVIQRIYRFAMALKACGVNADKSRVAVLISMDEAFTLLDFSRSDSWQLDVWAPNQPGGLARVMRYELFPSPRPGVAWARLFGVSLIIESDVVARDDD